jgi:hypothetical protein
MVMGCDVGRYGVVRWCADGGVAHAIPSGATSEDGMESSLRGLLENRG